MGAGGLAPLLLLLASLVEAAARPAQRGVTRFPLEPHMRGMVATLRAASAAVGSAPQVLLKACVFVSYDLLSTSSPMARPLYRASLWASVATISLAIVGFDTASHEKIGRVVPQSYAGLLLAVRCAEVASRVLTLALFACAFKAGVLVPLWAEGLLLTIAGMYFGAPTFLFFCA